jgi:hypothetical protein
MWRDMEFSLEKVPTIFCVICKLHNVCIDWWTMNYHTSASLGRFSDFSDVEAPPFSDDGYLWERFDITVGLQRCYYAARNGTRQNAIMEDLWTTGIRFNSVDEIYYKEIVQSQKHTINYIYLRVRHFIQLLHRFFKTLFCFLFLVQIIIV